MTTRAWPWDSPAVRKRSIRYERTGLLSQLADEMGRQYDVDHGAAAERRSERERSLAVVTGVRDPDPDHHAEERPNGQSPNHEFHRDPAAGQTKQQPGLH